MKTTDLTKNSNGIEAELLSAIEEFCKASHELTTMDDIKSFFYASTDLGKAYPFLASAIQSHLSLVKQCEINSRAEKVGGHVYAVEYSNGLVKIGKTMNPEQRMSTLRTMSSATTVRHFMSESTIEPHRIEAFAHKHFKPYRKHGEFFAVSMDDAVAFISQKINQFNP